MPTSTPTVEANADLLAALQALGLNGVTAKEVAAAVRMIYPSGTVGVEQGEVVRGVFLRLKLGLMDASVSAQ